MPLRIGKLRAFQVNTGTLISVTCPLTSTSLDASTTLVTICEEAFLKTALILHSNVAIYSHTLCADVVFIPVIREPVLVHSSPIPQSLIISKGDVSL
jgi:hypothetical protein